MSLICGSTEKEELRYLSEWIIALNIFYGEAFSSAGLYPIIAGYDKDGKCTYVGAASCYYSCPLCHNDIYGGVTCAVTEGMKREDLWIEVECCQQKALLFPDEDDCLKIYCLRYAPDAYPDNSDKFSIDDRGVNATGPFAWRPVRSQPVRKPKRGPIRRIFSLEEVTSLEKEGVLIFESRAWGLKYATDIEASSEPGAPDHCEADDRNEVRDDHDHDPVKGKDEAKQFGEPSLETISEESDSRELLEPIGLDTTEMDSHIQMGKYKLNDGEVEIKSESESESFVEEAVEPWLPGKIDDVVLESESSSDTPLICSGRIDTGNSVELAEKPVGKIETLHVSETIRAGKYQLLDSAHRNY